MNNFYLKLRQGVNSLPSRMFKAPKLETGFTMLEAVVVVGVLLALAIGGFLSYGPITENAKIAKLKSTAAEVYTAAQASNADGDPSTNPQDIIDTYNASTNKIHVEILEPGGAPLIGAMTTSLTVPAAYVPVPGEDFCVAATYITASNLQAGFGACPADLSGAIEPVPDDNTEPEPEESPNVDDKNGNGIPDSEEPPAIGAPGDKSHLPASTSTEGYIVLKFDTSAEAQCSTINLPIGVSYHLSVNWGDGAITTTRPAEHTYSEQGIRYIVVKGEITEFGAENWEDAACLLEVPSWTAATATKNMSYAFNNTTRLTSVKQVPQTVTNLQGAFKNSTYNMPLNGWGGLPKLTTAYEMFKNNKNFNQPIVFFPDAMQNTASMFEGATSMNSQVNLSGANRGQALNNISKMFKDATAFNANVYLGYADLVVDASSMFENATSFNKPLDLSLGFTNNPQAMFKNATSFNQPVSTMKFGWAANYSEMFMGATSFNQPVSSFTMKSTESHQLRSMFESATSFNQPLYGWDISKSQVLSRMFWNTPSFKQNLSSMKIYYGLSGTSTDFSDGPDRSWWPAGLAKP